MQGYEDSFAHRSNQSLSLQAPGGILLPSQNVRQGRRMTSPAMASENSLTLPDGGRQPSPRPPSPLRNSFTMSTSTGIDFEGHSEDGSDDEDYIQHRGPGWKRSPSPTSSVSGLAASFVQRMGNFVGKPAPRSPLPSDAELEAEAERERERSRREAEAILTREAQEAQKRQQVEQRLMAMMDKDHSKGLPPPPPSRSYTLPATPSPASSHKEPGSWWQSAKNRLTPTKEKDSPLTPAQQIILDAKAKEKDTTVMPPSMSNLNIPVQPPTRKPVPVSPSSPTPSRPSLSTPNLSPSPMRTIDSMSNSPSREAPPVYAQFTPQGTLDVPGTLLAIAKRFEKLEKWTIGHVRALEDRMNDVERWLVDKENNKEEAKPSSSSNSNESNSQAVQQEMGELREEISELQGRVGELGREMAKMATAPSNLSSGPKQQTAAVNVAPRQASTTLVHESLENSIPEVFSTPRHTRLPSSARESTSPPLASAKTASGTRLPYPTGDYNSPQDSFSPPGSPPTSLNAAMRRNSNSISGLPTSAYSGSDSPISSVFNLAATLNSRPLSPPVSAAPLRSSPAQAPSTPSPAPPAKKDNGGLPPPKASAQRTSSVSPTPRKRYTVALGGPIVAPPELQSNAPEIQAPKRTGTPVRSGRHNQQRRLFSEDEDEDDEDGNDGDGGETIGKSSSARFTKNLSKKRSNTSLSSVTSMSSVDKEVLASGTPAARYPGGDYQAPAVPSPVLSNRRAKAQSVYGMSSFNPPSAQANNSNNTSTTNGGAAPTSIVAAASASGDSINTTAPLRLKTRSKSSDRLSSDGGTLPPLTPSSAKFVDPLLLRRKQEVAAGTPGGGGSIAMPKPSGGKLAVGQLVAFFDKDKKRRR